MVLGLDSGSTEICSTIMESSEHHVPQEEVFLSFTIIHKQSDRRSENQLNMIEANSVQASDADEYCSSELVIKPNEDLPSLVNNPENVTSGKDEELNLENSGIVDEVRNDITKSADKVRSAKSRNIHHTLEGNISKEELDCKHSKNVNSDLQTCDNEELRVDTDPESDSNSTHGEGFPQVILTMSESSAEESSTPTEICTQNLDEYMDVVTTYKCKFCRFSCQWKSGLMSHIRNCHLEAQKESNVSLQKTFSLQRDWEVLEEPSPESASSTELSNGNMTDKNIQIINEEQETEDVIGLSGSSENKNEVQEQHIFLCGECSQGFNSLDICKEHMVQVHKIILSGVLHKEKKVSKRTFLKVRKKCQREEEDEVDSPLSPSKTANTNHDSELVGKRTVKVPRSLELDFMLDDNRKRRDRREAVLDKVYRCSEPGCSCRFRTAANLEYHRQCHLSEEGPFTCPECSERFDQWRRLLMHLWKEHLVDLDLYSCMECGYKSYSQFKLDTHMKIHSEVREFACTLCDKRFKQLSQLRNHNVVHMDRNQKSGKQKRWYSTQECEICKRTFSDSKCLRKHQQAVHSKLKPYVCTFCNHTSARKAMLQLHMRQHTGEKPFSCEHCEYKTGDHNSLRRHRMRHTGSKPYKCSHCSYACIQAISLKTHLKNKHPGLEGLFACRLCGFRSVRKENFMNHMADHKRGVIPVTATNDKPLEAGVEASHLDLSDGATQKLDTMLPGNIISAQLICSCLNALSQDGETIDLPPGVITSAEDGTQTITIQIPANADQETGEQYYFTIQQGAAQNNLSAQVAELADGESININDFITNEVLENTSVFHDEGSC